MMSVCSNFLCGRPHGADPSLIPVRNYHFNVNSLVVQASVELAK